VYDAFLTFLIRLIGAVAAFGMQALLARLMQIDDFGHYVLVWTSLLSVGSFATLGFAESALRFAPRYAVRGRAGDLLGFFKNGFFTIASASALIATVGIATEIWAPFTDTTRSLIFYVALAIPFLALEYFLEGMARAMGWFRLTTVTVYIVRPAAVAAACLLLHYSGVAMTAQTVCRIVIASLALTSIFILLVMWKRLGDGTSHREPARGQRQLWLKASLPLLAVAILDDIMTNGDIALVGLLTTPHDAAQYFVAGRVLVLASFAQFALYFVYGRKFSLAFADRGTTTGPSVNTGELQHLLLSATLTTVCATLAALAVMLVLGPYLLALFGTDYVARQELLWLLSLVFIARGFSGQAHQMLMIAGRQMTMTIINAAAVLFAGLLIFVLTPSHGAEGAAIGVAIASALRAVMLLTVALRLAQARGQ
jgi:O-antigen/teichoic acid export membrane protein